MCIRDSTRPGGTGSIGSGNSGSNGNSGNNGGRWSGPSAGQGGTVTGRPGSVGGRTDGDVGDGTTTPPVRPGGVSSRPGAGSSANPVATWRTPNRGRGTATGGSTGSVQSRPGSTGGSGGIQGRPGGTVTSRKPTYITPTHRTRPPRVNRDRWLDGTRHFGGRNWDIVPLGFYDPWACYKTSSPWFHDVRFYYPYYYIGPYYNGFYYSPFHMYGTWFPTYIYPERVIYITQRVYLRDIVSDDDYYDPYGDTVQFSLRDTMDDLKAAWLYGDGGRLLQHVNAAVPVRIYQRGVYKYSLEPEDYRDITKDALNRVETTGFEWVKIDPKRSDEVVLIAKHTFRDPDGDRHTIRLSYTLEKARGSWWITETGTSAWAGDI